jgi:hypothetical protein
LVAFDSLAASSDIVRTILAFAPDVVGLSIVFQCMVEDNLNLTRQLRNAGYRGHLTCGGHVPTFCYRELLSEAPEIDTVVRHEGEQTFVELLDTLEGKQAHQDIPGLVWRDDRGIAVGPSRPLIRDLDQLPRPLRQRPPLVVGGAPIAVMLTSRGCIGECAYCCLRAFSKDAGGNRLRLRDTDAVADEIAEAYHNIGVRVIIVQDDLFILPSEKKSISRMNAITLALESRGVDRVLFWLKGRPETITPAVAQAAREMGAIHLFLGVENAASERLRYLGRTHTHRDSANAISYCLEQNIRSSFNFMLFDPDCTLEEIVYNIDFASHFLNLTWNVCRTEIYPGTPLLSKLVSEGRLVGNWRAYGYEMLDTRAEIMFRILRVCFDERAFDNESLLNRLINLSFTRHVHEELLPGPATEKLSREVDQLVHEVYRDTVQELREVADAALRFGPNDVKKCQDFAVEKAMSINERDLFYTKRLNRMSFLLDARGAKIRSAPTLAKVPDRVRN